MAGPVPTLLVGGGVRCGVGDGARTGVRTPDLFPALAYEPPTPNYIQTVTLPLLPASVSQSTKQGEGFLP